MQKTEGGPTVQLMNDVTERRSREILAEVPMSKVSFQAEEGQVALTVEVAGRPVFREFIVPELGGPCEVMVRSLLELRHIAIHCPAWKCEAGELEERAYKIRRAALEDNGVWPITIHGFRYDREGNEERVL